MEMNSKKIRNLLISVAAILLILSGLFIYRSINLSGKLRSARMEKESALSEKINLNKKMDALQLELNSFSAKNAELSSILEDTKERFTEKEQEIARLRQSLATLSSLKKKSSELESVKLGLEQTIDALNKNALSLKDQISSLEQQIAQANADKLSSEGKLNELQSKPYSDNFRTEAQRGRKNILTVNSRWTKRLNISLDVPDNLKQAINFTITTPDGIEVSSAGDISNQVKILHSDASFVVDQTGISGTGSTMKRVQLIYTPSKRLKKGIYKYQIYSGIQYVGSVQVNLK
jgi:small-conductance mechanosensitive channel